MNHPASTRISLLTAFVSGLLLAACAAERHAGEHTAKAVNVNCPAGHTLTCETRTTGRIHHGTFGKDNDRCACMSDDGGALQTPVIPGIRQ